jgi:hypothetical protein
MSSGCCLIPNTKCCQNSNAETNSQCECISTDLNGNCQQYVYTYNPDCSDKLNVKNTPLYSCLNNQTIGITHQELVRAGLSSSEIHKFIDVYVNSLLWKKPNDGSTLFLNVRFDNVNTEAWKKLWIEKTIKETFEPIIDVVFNFSQNASRNITIEFVSNGNNSPIGKNSAYETMQLYTLDNPSSFTYNGQTFNNLPTTNNTYGSTLIHEFCHALGMHHELQNTHNTIQYSPDNLQGFFGAMPHCWDDDKIQTYITDNTFKNYRISNTRVQPQTLQHEQSIMFYTLPSWTMVGCPVIKEAHNLSTIDILWLQQMYGISTQIKKESINGVIDGDNDNYTDGVDNTSGGNNTIGKIKFIELDNITQKINVPTKQQTYPLGVVVFTMIILFIFFTILIVYFIKYY